MFEDKFVLLRGGGDIATGIAYVLHNAGFKIIITEIFIIATALFLALVVFLIKPDYVNH